VIVQGKNSNGYAIDLHSGPLLSVANTTVLASTGGLSFQSGSTNILWSAAAGSATTPTFGSSPYTVTNGFKALMFWTESTTGVSFQGGPAFTSDGIFALPNGPLNIQGAGLLDARDVQFWCATATTNNASAVVYLRPDLSAAIRTFGTGSALIR
jgi:hypothetical protein